MTDEALRALERDVASGGVPSDRLALAAALERLGRPDDAILALRPARADAQVRARLARAPVGASVGGASAGVDVRPIVDAPSRRWHVQLGPGGETSLAWLIASELGVVCAVDEGARLLVLDPDTGAVRWSMARAWARGWRVPFQGCGVVVAGERLVVSRNTSFEVRDLWTGEVRGRGSPDGGPGPQYHLAVSGDRIVTAGRGQLSAWPLDLRGEGEPLWRVQVQAPATWVSGDLILAPGPDRSRRIALEDGRELGEVAGQVAAGDARGFVLHHDEHMELCDPGVAPLWRADDETVVSLGAVVITYRARTGLRARDRATGAVLGGISAVRAHVDPVVTRDVVFGVGAMRDQEPAPANSPIVAQRADGTTLWSLVHEPPWSRVIALAPLTDRLYALSEDGTLGCYEVRASRPESGPGGR